MRFFPRLSGWSRICAVAVALVTAGAATASEKIAQAVRDSLPRYDPAQRAAAEQARAGPPTERSPLLSPTAQPPPDAPARPPSRVTDPNVVQLDPFTVHSHRPRPAVKLPRLSVPQAEAAAATGGSDPFLSPAERSRRLRKKHLNVLTMLLNPGFFGGGLAGGAEERERYAGQLNGLADDIELAAATGASAEELKQLRELYLQLYLARPK